MTDWTFEPMGEAALLCAAPEPNANGRALALAQMIRAQPSPGVQSALAGLASVLVQFDPCATDHRAIEQALRAQIATMTPLAQPNGRLIEVPVVYGGAAGPDLEDVAAALGCSPAEVIARHTAEPFRVMMIGFAPGYPYIGPVPFAEQLPRRAIPRSAVPAGSVGLAAGLTGIYPAQLPGGWQLIGRTDLPLFDPAAEPPTLFEVGDLVRFVAIQPTGDQS